MADDPFAAQLRGRGPVGIAATAVVVSGNLLFSPLSAILALAWARLSRTPWRDLGLVGPASWLRTVLVGLAFGAALKLLTKSVVMPLLGAPAVNPYYHFLQGNTAALPGALVAVIVVAGFGEELLFRGFLFERLGSLLGRGRWARSAIVVLTTLLFAAAHFPDQGIWGVTLAAMTGLAFGATFAVTRRLPMVMVAHAAFDLVAVGLIYWDAEAAVAGWFFR